jgi:hypothetical protein
VRVSKAYARRWATFPFARIHRAHPRVSHDAGTPLDPHGIAKLMRAIAMRLQLIGHALQRQGIGEGA